MAVRKRRPAPKSGPSAPTSRVRALHDLEQWRTILSKAGGRLVVVQFYQAQNYACSQMRGFFKRMSVDPALKAALFAEVEVDTADEIVEACGLNEGNTKVPCYRCYVKGVVVDEFAGGVPTTVMTMIQRQLAQLRGSGGGLIGRLLLAAGVLAGGAAAAYWRFGRASGGADGGGADGVGGSGGNLGDELRSLAERIGKAQQRLRNAERLGKVKAARNQRNIIQKLQGQQRAVEQRVQQRNTPLAPEPSGGGGSRKGGKARSGKGGSGGGARKGGSGKGARAGGGAARRRAAAAVDDDALQGYSDWDVTEEEQQQTAQRRRQRLQAAAGAVYSDEE